MGLMLVLAVVCGVMVPRVNVNTDMTKYLPRDSEMKKGLDRMKDELGQDAANMLSVRAMYKGLTREEKDSVRRMLAGMEDVEMVTSVEQKGEYVLYDMTIVTNGDPKGVAREIRNGEKEVVVETSIDGNLPDVSVFFIAGLLVFVILFLMCESWMEPLLFLATIGVAVVMNVGGNVLLESVSMTTNAIVAILQLVLSMDYSIILMNRYRQEVERMRREGTVDKKAAVKSRFGQLGNIAWDEFVKFWGALVALLFGVALFVVRKFFRKKTGYDGSGESTPSTGSSDAVESFDTEGSADAGESSETGDLEDAIESGDESDGADV